MPTTLSCIPNNIPRNEPNILPDDYDIVPILEEAGEVACGGRWCRQDQKDKEGAKGPLPADEHVSSDEAIVAMVTKVRHQKHEILRGA